jgi:hypothetical protein
MREAGGVLSIRKEYSPVVGFECCIHQHVWCLGASAPRLPATRGCCGERWTRRTSSATARHNRQKWVWGGGGDEEGGGAREGGRECFRKLQGWALSAVAIGLCGVWGRQPLWGGRGAASHPGGRRG